MLKNVSYNYEIQFTEKEYLQVRGVSTMGSHEQDYIEQQALDIWKRVLPLTVLYFYT